jgi:hypothetical protein
VVVVKCSVLIWFRVFMFDGGLSLRGVCCGEQWEFTVSVLARFHLR